MKRGKRGERRRRGQGEKGQEGEGKEKKREGMREESRTEERCSCDASTSLSVVETHCLNKK
jgi:hypothetical protein